MTGFEYRRITETLNKFEKDVEESTFLGVPIMDLNKYQLEKLVCFLNSKMNKYLNLEEPKLNFPITDDMGIEFFCKTKKKTEKRNSQR